MKIVSNRKWNIGEAAIADNIRRFLLDGGGEEDAKITSSHELWRIKFSDATFTYYKKGTLFVTDSDDGALIPAHEFIDSLAGSKFIPPSRDILIGFDETGKGEVLGHLVLAGVVFPSTIFGDLESVIGVADTKVRHSADYWDEIFKRIDIYKDKGLEFFLEKIPPWHIDKYNVNKLLDLTYQRILLHFATKHDLRQCRIVLDDYGIGASLGRYLKSLQNGGAEIVKTTKADDTYLEARIASLIAKREQQKVMEAISKNPEFQLAGKPIGSGNAGDSETVDWLNAWCKTGKEWPWFVKRSFRTVQEIEGKKYITKKLSPPINDHLLAKEFRQKFENGELNIKSLSVVCPSCGTVAKSAKLAPIGGMATPLCTKCGKEFQGLSLTLRYYCGRILPDSNIIGRGFLSKDLETAKFFENFTILLHPVVKKESDGPGGKKELARIGTFASIGRIRLEETSSLLDPNALDNISRDEAIQLAAEEHNAILVTADNGMKGSAQAKGLFVLEI
jgi:ribonuclease HII